ncbi:MAG TPA: ubiquinol-cytochrome C chaperone family protein [Stellaceae bacterium]|jgi:cytochrome b pre-mRNA-processing protein 3|nr:ubiquinol-cytochrome C chaperone family protein [Stellaceae bacterium]
MRSLFRRNPLKEPAERAYDTVVAQARRPEFFTLCGVPDTLDGRFELICLHAFLFLHRLKHESAPAGELGQAFFDTMFVDFDRSLREIGTGDLSVGREVKKMAQSFFGRIQAYEQGLEDGDAGLAAALSRNLFGTAAAEPAAVAAVAAYLRRETTRLRGQSRGELLDGRVSFGPPPQDVATLARAEAAS